VLPGRSALPAFLAVEAALAEELETGRETGRKQIAEAEEEAARLREEARARLERVLVDAQEAAVREVERQARERVNEARAQGQRWVDEAERVAGETVGDALDLCCGS
jgi:hypothetical protein